MQSVCPIHDGNLNYKLSFETEKLPFDKGKKNNSNFHFNAIKKVGMLHHIFFQLHSVSMQTEKAGYQRKLEDYSVVWGLFCLIFPPFLCLCKGQGGQISTVSLQ